MASLRPMITGVVPTVCFSTQLPRSTWGIIFRMLERSLSSAARKLGVGVGGWIRYWKSSQDECS